MLLQYVLRVTGVGLGEDYEEEALAEAQRAVGCNTDLYVVNQEAQNTDLLREAHTGDARRPVRLSFTFMVGQVKTHFNFTFYCRSSGSRR